MSSRNEHDTPTIFPSLQLPAAAAAAAAYHTIPPFYIMQPQTLQDMHPVSSHAWQDIIQHIGMHSMHGRVYSP